MRALRLKTVGAAVLLCASFYFGSGAYCLREASRGGEHYQSKVTGAVYVEGGVLRIEGAINASMAERVQMVLRNPDLSIRAVALDSTGGVTTAAAMIGEAIVDRYDGRMPIAVENGDICMSACVMILLAGPDEIADRSLILFHEGRNYTEFEGCRFCRLLARVDDDLSSTPAQRHVMEPWAEKLSPRLLAFLKACPESPFDTPDGRTFTGAQFKAVRDGRAAFTCADLPSTAEAIRIFRAEFGRGLTRPLVASAAGPGAPR